MAKLKYRKIRCKSSLLSFLSNDPESHISLHNHGNIIATITNTRNSFIINILDRLGNKSFLRRTASANTNRFCTWCSLKELLCDELILHYFGECSSINHQHCWIFIHFFIIRYQLVKIILVLQLITPDFVDLFCLSIHSNCDGDAFRSLNLITSEHPDLYSGSPKLFDCFQHILL